MPREICGWARAAFEPFGRRESRRQTAAEGRAVKIVSPLLRALPADREYRIVYMLRPLEETVASQTTMIGRRGAAGSALPPENLAEALGKHLAQIDVWLEGRVCRVEYHVLLNEPRLQAERVAGFLGAALDIDAMVSQVDVSLYRHRSPAVSG